MSLATQKGRKRLDKYNKACMTASDFQRCENAMRPAVFVRSIKGGYSGWRRAWARLKTSAFEQRFAPLFRACPQWAELPVRHPRIRIAGEAPRRAGPVSQVMWHAVADRLPDNGMTVLIHVQGGNDPVAVGFLDAGDWYYDDAFPCYLPVTHWADFPDPHHVA